MNLGRYPSLLVTGARKIKEGDGYLLGYVFGSTGSAATLQFVEANMTGNEIWRDVTPATAGYAARFVFPGRGLYFKDALYVTGTGWPSNFTVIYQ